MTLPAQKKGLFMGFGIRVKLRSGIVLSCFGNHCKICARRENLMHHSPSGKNIVHYNGETSCACGKGTLRVLCLDLSDGKIFTTMEWLMVFCQSTIVFDGFSMFFFTCEPLVPMVFQWFFRFQPLVSMVFPMVFSNPTIAIE